MIKTAATIGTAALFAALVSFVPVPEVAAGTPKPGMAAAPLAAPVQPAGAHIQAADPAGSAANCMRAWPYYEQGCLTGFEARWQGERRSVRLVTTDRLD